jgi:serine/threonine protein kinase
MPQRTSDEPSRFSASSLPSDVEPVEREFVQLLERALAPSFTLVRRLGSGGMGAVYLARDPVLKRLVAVKVMAPSLAAESAARARFEREAQAVASISHPNVVSVYSVGELANGVPYLVMQYVEGRTMSERLKSDGPLDVRAAKRVLGEVASALAAAHRKGIIHRDIKPANILWDDDTGRALVTDFGIAAVLERGDAERDAVRITHTGMAVGTPAYMSPEQLLAEPITEKTDIYSLGLLGYELLIGEGPYQISSPRELMAAHLRDAPRRLSTLRSDVDAELERLLEGCLAKDPAQRPSAADVESRLAHGASVLLEWPPPGLEHFRESLRGTMRYLLIGGFAVGIPLVALSVFDRESFVRQSLPSPLFTLSLTAVGLLIFGVGCVGLGRFFKAAQKAVTAGYGWGTVAEIASDVRGDTGALIAGGREYAALAPEERSTLRRYRVVGSGLRLLAGLMPVAGYGIGVLLAARAASGPTVVLWCSIVLAVTLLVAARALAWQENRTMRPARTRLRSATTATRTEDANRLAQTWTATFEQVRAGQAMGGGRSAFARPMRIAIDAVLVAAVWTTLLILIVQGFTTMMAVVAEIAMPKFSNTQQRIARIQRLAAYRLTPDSSISAVRAGQALHAVSRAGAEAPLMKWEAEPAFVIPIGPPAIPAQSPFPGEDGAWVSGAFRQARRGLNPAQRAFLQAIAGNAALGEFRTLARAPALDLPAAFWNIPRDSNPAWPALPIPKFVPIRAAAQANVAQAALDLAAGRSRDAEQRLRENISVGFLLIRDGDFLLMNLIGASLVTNTRVSLAALFEATGRAREARAVSAEGDPVLPVAEPDRRRRVPVDEISRTLRRVILDTTEIRGLRWEFLFSYSLEPCADMHQVVFGPDSLHRATMREARKSLVRRSSDSTLFAIAESTSERPARSAPVRGLGMRVIRPLVRTVSAITGHRQLEGCFSLFGYR